MNPVDVVVFVFALIMAIKGMIRGFVRELFGLAALILGVFIAHMYHAYLGHIIASHITVSLPAANVSAFFIIFFSVYVVLFFIGVTISSMIRRIDLGFIDRVFGFAFGASKAFLVVMMIVLFLDSFSMFASVTKRLRKDSRVFSYMERFMYTNNIIERLEDVVNRGGLKL